MTNLINKEYNLSNKKTIILMTVSMIKTCEVDENPVTWDNVEIATIGPENVRTVTNSWFLNHRAMIEEI